MISVNLEENSALLLEFQAGNEQAFDQVFIHFYPLLCVFAERILQDEALSQDIAQDSLIKAWNKRNDFLDFGKLKSFLYTCVRNASFNELEKHKVKIKYQSTLEKSEPADDYNPLKDMIHAEVVSRIFAKVDTLPEQCRKVIHMTYMEGKTPKEISEALNITVSTVNSQKMRGLQLLKGKLSDHDMLTAIVLLLPGVWK
ncbi:RNA polymerase sigma-70 factor, ECF subfamily [Pedobacter sp. ok626]|uniref:RNA polymerase sigma factor n=1 Tax=Pedobacter sp. ok626 TaxID=1761882 RepID=UPI000882C7E9|nr:RNA polymerase sigma-70 factor [Pedobacter sp. ok626]SDL87393.1 RNA polymerase sigma-70 factor, ECF subfamily [Pedobacter sp. ok626]